MLQVELILIHNTSEAW